MKKDDVLVSFQYIRKKKPALNIRVLMLLNEIHESGSIVEASQRMGVERARACKDIKKFETIVGKKIIVRRGPNGSELTDFGRELLTDYKRFLEMVYNSEFFEKYQSIII